MNDCELSGVATAKVIDAESNLGTTDDDVGVVAEVEAGD